MIRRRDSRAELSVDHPEHIGHGERYVTQVEKDHARDDALWLAGLWRFRAGLLLFRAELRLPGDLLQDLLHAREVLIADKELSFGVHIADAAVRGNDLDLCPVAVEFPVFTKGFDYVINLIKDPGF
jgi:hypothetical protein